MAKQKHNKSKRELIDEFNSLIDKKEQSGIPLENLPSKITDREYGNLNLTEAKRLVSTLKKGEFYSTIISTEDKFTKEKIALTQGMLDVDSIRMQAQNRYQHKAKDRIQKLASFKKADDISKLSILSRGDVEDLTAGDRWLSPVEKARRVRSHEEFYSKKSGEILKNFFITTLVEQNTLYDISEYIDYLKGIDAQIFEDAYHSDVRFDVVEFYKGAFEDDFMTELNKFKGIIEKVIDQNKNLYNKKQFASAKSSGKFYDVYAKIDVNVNGTMKKQSVKIGKMYREKPVGISGYGNINVDKVLTPGYSKFFNKGKTKMIKVKFEESI